MKGQAVVNRPRVLLEPKMNFLNLMPDLNNNNDNNNDENLQKTRVNNLFRLR